MSFTTRATATNNHPQPPTTKPAPNTPPPTLAAVSTQLLHDAHLVPAPLKPHDATSTALIASLRLHPTLEATLHLLNADLPSAHFLVRHMQAPPALEGMLLHGILHRCEGDFGNARAWISDVGDACAGWVPKRREQGERLDSEVWKRTRGAGGVDVSLVEFVYGDQGADAATRLVDDVKRMRGEGGDGAELERRIAEEMRRMLEWCRAKFGDGEWVNAQSAWVKNSAEVQEMSNDMVSGDKGWRKF